MDLVLLYFYNVFYLVDADFLLEIDSLLMNKFINKVEWKLSVKTDEGKLWKIEVIVSLIVLLQRQASAGNIVSIFSNFDSFAELDGCWCFQWFTSLTLWTKLWELVEYYSGKTNLERWQVFDQHSIIGQSAGGLYKILIFDTSKNKNLMEFFHIIYIFNSFIFNLFSMMNYLSVSNYHVGVHHCIIGHSPLLLKLFWTRKEQIPNKTTIFIQNKSEKKQNDNKMDLLLRMSVK
jgi:hypothetical protein